MNNTLGEVLEKVAGFDVLTLVFLPGRHDILLSFGFLVYKTKVLLNDLSPRTSMVIQGMESIIQSIRVYKKNVDINSERHMQGHMWTSIH